MIPGVPLRYAPGYVLVAPLGRICPRRIHPGHGGTKLRITVCSSCIQRIM